jgi:hypothetical protein
VISDATDDVRLERTFVTLRSPCLLRKTSGFKCLLLAQSDISRRRNNSVVIGVKQTFSEPRLENRIYEYAP